MVHGCIVYTERAETAADSCGTSYASAVSTPLRWMRYKKDIHSCRITCEHSESARERRIALYKSDQQQGRLVFAGGWDIGVEKGSTAVGGWSWPN